MKATQKSDLEPAILAGSGKKGPRSTGGDRRLQGCLALAYLAAVSTACAAGFFNENFDGYTVNPTNVSQIGNGWNATGTCTVDAGVGTNGTRGMDLGLGAKAWNAVTTNATPNRIWSDLLVNETNFATLDTLSPVLPSTAVMVVIVTNTSNANGLLYVMNPVSSVWEACTGNATNGPVAAITTGSWVRISVFQNYDSHVATIFLNGVPVRTNWPFINTGLSSYTNLACEGAADGNAFLDNVSVSNAVPPGLTSDINGNQMPDAMELTLYGSLNVWTGSTITASVTNPAGGMLSPSGTVTRILYGNATNFGFAANAGYVLDTAWTNGVLATNFAQQGKSGNYTWTGITTDGTFQVGFSYNGIWYVPGDYGSLTAAVAVARANETIILGNGIGSETVTLASNLTFIGTNVAGLASLTVQAGVTNTLQGFTNFTAAALTMMSNGVMVVSNSVLNLTSLTVQTNAFIHGYNSTAVVNGVVYSGNFTLDQNWNLVLMAKPLNFTDGFETYSLSTPLHQLGPYGWNASTSTAMVVENPDTVVNPSARVAMAPNGSIVSNLVTGAGLVGGIGPTNVWVDLMFRQTAQQDGPDAFATNGPVVFFVNTNGWLTVLTPGGWDICSNDVQGAAAPNIATDTWAQITCLLNFSVPAGKVSYFVDGHLVRQNLPFAHPADHIGGVKVATEDASAWMDNVNIQTNLPAGLTNNWPGASDQDHDGITDAVELIQKGAINDPPLLSGPTVSAVDTNAATLGASVTNDGGIVVTSWGIVWDTNLNPMAHMTTITGETNAPFSFTTNVAGFSPGQHYYVRGWASNAMGIAYSTNGEFYAEPLQASSLAAVPVAGGFTISWTADATSTGTVVVVKPEEKADAYPLDGSNYHPNASYGRGDELGTSNYVVYVGSGTNVTVDSLVYGVHYRAAAFAYAGHDTLIQYRTNSPATWFLLQWPACGSVYTIR